LPLKLGKLLLIGKSAALCQELHVELRIMWSWALPDISGLTDHAACNKRKLAASEFTLGIASTASDRPEAES
jgi:hypothetical protein